MPHYKKKESIILLEKEFFFALKISNEALVLMGVLVVSFS